MAVNELCRKMCVKSSFPFIELRFIIWVNVKEAHSRICTQLYVLRTQILKLENSLTTSTFSHINQFFRKITLFSPLRRDYLTHPVLGARSSDFFIFLGDRVASSDFDLPLFWNRGGLCRFGGFWSVLTSLLWGWWGPVLTPLLTTGSLLINSALRDLWSPNFLPLIILSLLFFFLGFAGRVWVFKMEGSFCGVLGVTNSGLSDTWSQGSIICRTFYDTKIGFLSRN